MAAYVVRLRKSSFVPIAYLASFECHLQSTMVKLVQKRSCI